MGVFAYYPAFIQWFPFYSDLSLTVVILREPFSSCHPGGAKRPKDLAQDKFRDRRILFKENP
jgi:hypothetical protein